MSINKKLIAKSSSMVAFGILLAAMTVAGTTTETVMATENKMAETTTYKLQTSVGAIAHIGNSIVLEEEVEIVEVEAETVGQSQEAVSAFGYTNLGIAVVEGNLNVRESADASASIAGKMTNHAACEILATEGEWTKIVSGNVEGYVKSEYLVTGEEALAIAQTEARTMATVKTDTLRVREQATTDSRMLSTVSNEEELSVVEVLDGWVKVEVDNYQGYVSAEYVEVGTKLKTGNTLKELSYGTGVSDTRVNLVNYALQFVGNRYVWGGTSLTNGVDCSGFTMRVYQQFGISLPHHSGSQPSRGTKISRDEIKPGDLIFYGNGSKINHVAIYIGDGQVVHASNAKDGIKISKAFYRTPVCIVSYL